MVEYDFLCVIVITNPFAGIFVHIEIHWIVSLRKSFSLILFQITGRNPLFKSVEIMGSILVLQFSSKLNSELMVDLSLVQAVWTE